MLRSRITTNAASQGEVEGKKASAMATEDSVDVFSCLSRMRQDMEFPDPALRTMELLTPAVPVSAERGVPVMLSPLLSVHNS